MLIGIGTTGFAREVAGEILSVGTLDSRVRFYPVRTSACISTRRPTWGQASKGSWQRCASPSTWRVRDSLREATGSASSRTGLIGAASGDAGEAFGGFSDTKLAFGGGVGADVDLTRRLAVRTQFDLLASFADIVEANTRFAVGLVARLGGS